jgi:hypothetical protein
LKANSPSNSLQGKINLRNQNKTKNPKTYMPSDIKSDMHLNEKDDGMPNVILEK